MRAEAGGAGRGQDGERAALLAFDPAEAERLRNRRSFLRPQSETVRSIGALVKFALRREFAVQALTSARTALETALNDARKQQRYLAIYVRPREPTSTIYPRRFLNSVLAAFWFFLVWAVDTFIYRSVRDHAI